MIIKKYKIFDVGPEVWVERTIKRKKIGRDKIGCEMKGIIESGAYHNLTIRPTGCLLSE